MFGANSFAKTATELETEVSNKALAELIGQNPYVKPGDERDIKRQFSELLAQYLNPGIHTVFNEKTGEAVTHLSYSTNTCLTYENNTIYSLYNCSFVVGYANQVPVDEFNKISIDMSTLLSSGIQIEYEFKVVNSITKKEIIEPTYYIY